MRGMTYIDPKIREALRLLRAAKSHARRTLRNVQATCTHERVVESDYTPSEWFSPLPASRVCISCGLEEYSKYGTRSGGKWALLTEGRCSFQTNFKLKPKLTSEFVKYVPRDEIKKYWVKL